MTQGILTLQLRLLPTPSKELLRNVRVGLPPRQAAAAARVSFGSLYGWLEDETFRDDVQREEAVFELTLVARLQGAARRGSYRAAMFLLERGFPERWGRKEKIELSGPDRGPISVQRYEAMPDTELDAEFLRVKRIADEAN